MILKKKFWEKRKEDILIAGFDSVLAKKFTTDYITGSSI